MTTTCPRCGVPATGEYCDECGALIGPRPDATLSIAVDAALVVAPAPDPSGTPHAMSNGLAPVAAVMPVAASGEVCPRCATPRSGDDQFCESCGFDFAAGVGPDLVPPPPSPTELGWEVVVWADRAYYDRFLPEGVDFPTAYPARTFVLKDEAIRIGRRTSPTAPAIEIDLSGVPEDPGISRLHALLAREDDGRYSLVDPGSTNGTTINDDDNPVANNVPRLLSDGDRVHIGAWTTITVRSYDKLKRNGVGPE